MKTPLDGGHQIAIDTGGTFTDVAVRRPDGSIFVWKVSSTPAAPDEAVVEGLLGALEQIDVTPEKVSRLVHGTTVATNTVITRTGAKVGLVTTRGFRDLLDIGHQTRPSLYDQTKRRSAPLVEQPNVWEIGERTSSDGEALLGLDEQELQALADEIKAAAPDVIVVSLLNAYVNPAHERAVRDYLREAGAAPSIMSATEISPEIREFERTSTAVVNGYVQPKIASYLQRLERKVEEAAVASDLWIMQSNGGLLSPEMAQDQSARTVLSGLAGGVVGAGAWARQLGIPLLVSFDIGGTSTDIALIRDGKPEEIVSGEIEGLPLRLPTVDVHTIGAGGGSIAWLDSGGGLRVGPQSAGATPGPICYSRGGQELTVTDAHAVLGRLGEALLGGRLRLDLDAARSRMAEFGNTLGMSAEEAAEGILKVINANMARGVRRVSVERGVDLRSCDLMAFGGAGPLHGADLVVEMGMRSSIVPPMPGIASAVGMLGAPIRHDHSASTLAVHAGHMPDLIAQFESLEGSARAELAKDRQGIELKRFVDARYVGQSYELTVDFAADFDAIRASFDAAHAERYGFSDEDASMEVVAVRVVALGKSKTTDALAEWPVRDPGAPNSRRKVYFGGSWTDTPVYSRTDLAVDQTVPGPLVIEQFDSTIVINPGQECRTDEFGFLHITAKETL